MRHLPFKRQQEHQHLPFIRYVRYISICLFYAIEKVPEETPLAAGIPVLLIYRCSIKSCKYTHKQTCGHACPHTGTHEQMCYNLLFFCRPCSVKGSLLCPVQQQLRPQRQAAWRLWQNNLRSYTKRCEVTSSVHDHFKACQRLIRRVLVRLVPDCCTHAHMRKHIQPCAQQS